MKRLGAVMLMSFVTLSLLFAVAPPVFADGLQPSMETNFRCGNLLMDYGIDKLQVLANCGEPVASERSFIEQYGEVEKLVYGPDAGYYNVLYFFAGKLIKVESIREL